VSDIMLIARTATTFGRDGELDEEAMRQHLQRLVDANLTIYLGSGGSGEGCALTLDELRRVYELGIEVGQGKVTVGSNQPDQHTARDSIAHARLAIDAGIEVVQLYGPAAWHGYAANDVEYSQYFDRCLSAIDHRISISPNPTVGYAAKPKLIADIVNRHEQVEAVNLTGITGDGYFIQLKDALNREVTVTAEFAGAFAVLEMGGGLNIVGANFIPKTYRRFIDLYEAGETARMDEVYRDIRRVTAFCDQWVKASSPRVHKMAMRAFRLPGWEGGVREPHVMYDDAEVERFRTGVLALGVPEIVEMAEAAGAA
jgi:dihydrodipicolinate synthase/N-acetylneuraminate lyase